MIGAFNSFASAFRPVVISVSSCTRLSPRDFEPALIPVRQNTGGVVGTIGQPDAIEPIAGLVDGLGLCGLVAAGAKQRAESEAARAHQRVVLGDQQVFQHCHAAEQANILEGAGNLGFGGKDVVGVVRVVAARRAIAGLFELDEFGANLGAGQRAIRLGERSNRDNESNGNCNGRCMAASPASASPPCCRARRDSPRPSPVAAGSLNP